MYRTVRRGMAGPITFASADATRSSGALSIATAANPGAFSLVQQATAAAAGPIAQASTFDDSGMASGGFSPGPGSGAGPGGGPGPGPGPGAGRSVSAADAALCECYLDKVVPALEAQGMTVTDALGAALLTSCTDDPAAFAENLTRQGIDYNGCKPWYQRRTTLYVGGGVLALGLLYMVVRR
jgi:hypothetical protein